MSEGLNYMMIYSLENRFCFHYMYTTPSVEYGLMLNGIKLIEITFEEQQNNDQKMTSYHSNLREFGNLDENEDILHTGQNVLHP